MSAQRGRPRVAISFEHRSLLLVGLSTLYAFSCHMVRHELGHVVTGLASFAADGGMSSRISGKQRECLPTVVAW